MVDVETVTERLHALRACVAELDRYVQDSFEALTSDVVKYRAAERSLQLATRAVVDVATHVISADYDARAQNYRQAIERLGEVGVLHSDFAKRLAPIAGLRNILVHEYLAVDPQQLYEHLVRRRADLEEFGRHIAGYLQRVAAKGDARE